MNGHLLDNSKDLQDNHFYVAAGLEAFKNFPYWKSPKVPSEVQQWALSVPFLAWWNLPFPWHLALTYAGVVERYED